jgi:AraC-like DNA-binding protein
MKACHISTDVLSDREAFAFWQDVICETFIHLDCASANSRKFRGSLHNQPFGDLLLSSMASDPIDLSRTAARISAARDEYCLIVVQGSGRTLGEQTGFHHYVLKVPREAVRRRFGPIEALTATKISGTRGIGKIASNFVRGLHGELETLDEFASQRLAETSVDLIAAALASAMPTAVPVASTTRVAHLMRAKSFIAGNIHRYDLTSGHVAVAIGVSERYLRDLFAGEGMSLGRYIWTFRLERCRIALSDPSQAHRAISEIAFGWGFNDMSHFSHYFRERVGVSPREYRESVLGSVTAQSPNGPIESAEHDDAYAYSTITPMVRAKRKETR